MNKKIVGLLLCIIIFLLLIYFSKIEQFDIIGLQTSKVQQGPRGDKGIEGNPGLQGPIGKQGPQGKKGAKGPAGPTGKVGDFGPNGENLLDIIFDLNPELKSETDEKQIYIKFLKKRLDKSIKNKIRTKLEDLQTSMIFPDYTIILFELNKEWNQVDSSITDRWQLCDGSNLKYDSEETEVPGVKTPDFNNKFLKGGDYKNINNLKNTILEVTPGFFLQSNQIPLLNVSDFDKFTNKINLVNQNINNDLKTKFTDEFNNIKKNLDTQCKQIQIDNLELSNDNSGHNHTINYFNNNFNEYGAEGEPCSGFFGVIVNPKCGGTGDIDEPTEQQPDKGIWKLKKEDLQARPGFTIDYTSYDSNNPNVKLNKDGTRKLFLNPKSPFIYR